LIIFVYENTVGRTPAKEEIDIWKENIKNGVKVDEFLFLMDDSPESESFKAQRLLDNECNNSEYIQNLYEIVLARGAAPWEINYWQSKLDSGLNRSELLAELLKTRLGHDKSIRLGNAINSSSCMIMGTDKIIDSKQWEEKYRVSSDVVIHNKYKNKFILEKTTTLVSAIASMYKGDNYIERFMDNITSQKDFNDFCELIIVDADSPDNEYETIQKYLKDFKINYIRCNYRIGIYDAWNLAIKNAKGQYITNTNLDDSRRLDSLYLQASSLQQLNFVDIVYQDFLYTFDPNLDYEEVSKIGFVSNLPSVTSATLMKFNSPHNAPMWRKELHDEIGYFDTNYKSAGDYDFWMRCLAANKTFYKINDPHVIYYHNPEGLSTSANSRGLEEAMSITKKHSREITEKVTIIDKNKFIEEIELTQITKNNFNNMSRYHLTTEALRQLSRVKKFLK